MFQKIINANIVTPEKIYLADIIINDQGEITIITPIKNPSQTNDPSVFDAKSAYVLPGLIEVH